LKIISLRDLERFILSGLFIICIFNETQLNIREYTGASR